MDKITGKVWVFGDEINTDYIFPHSAFRVSPEEQCKLCMSDNRPGWSSLVEPGDIIVAGRNFGTGSSRPGAQVLKRLGLAAGVAESFNGLFYRNCISYGFPAIAVPDILQHVEEGDRIEVDPMAGTVTNLRTGEVLQGNKLSRSMAEIIDAGGIDQVLKAKGYFD